MTDLTEVVTAAARGAGRSQQVAIGPSEVGQTCERRLAMGLLGVEKVNHARDEWTASVGTAIHAWMEEAFKADNRRRVLAGQPPRWLTEAEIEIRTGLMGHCDLYDLETNTVIDHKFPGVTSIRKYRRQGHPGQQYRWQAHLYGYGFARMGFPVADVQLVMWPRSGLLRDAWVWSEPYSPAVAEEALHRLDVLLSAMDVAEGVGALGDLLDTLHRDTEHCGWCGFYDKEATDPTLACKGPFYSADHSEPIIAGLL